MSKGLISAIGIIAVVAIIIGKADMNAKHERLKREEAELAYVDNTKIRPRHSVEHPLEFEDNSAVGMKAYYRRDNESQEHTLLGYTCFDGRRTMFTFFAEDYYRFEKTNFQFTAYAVDRDGNRSHERKFFWTNDTVRTINNIRQNKNRPQLY